jgi:hypothetical protein
MESIEDLAMKVVNAYEDLFFTAEKKSLFDAVLDRYLSGPDSPDLYDTLVAFGYERRAEFDEIVRTLKDQSLL